MREHTIRQPSESTQVIPAFLVAIGFCTTLCSAQQKIELQTATKSVAKYERIEILIQIDGKYDSPFDPNEVDLTVLLNTPSGKELIVPAFYCQDYESRKIARGGKMEDWYYPIGQGTWKVRFSPVETGKYAATAVLKDRTGTIRSVNTEFHCTTSTKKGFVLTSSADPRFLEFTEGGFFFPIGQNLAFIGESQYVDIAKAEEIFGKLRQNGANFLRIWTCCEDWAMAIEARKSAWDRSWHRKNIIVPMPDAENSSNPRKCVKIEGADGISIAVEPSHPVALRPQTSYVLEGRFLADGPSALRVEAGRSDGESQFDAAAKGRWQSFKREFVTGQSEFWLGRLTLTMVGTGTIWIDGLSLKEAGGGPELLWEADVNRPIRGFYNQVDCFMLDRLIEAAEQNGIYLMLCLITRDLYMNSLSNDQSTEYQQAIRDAKNLMRYAVARWSYSTSVAAWEYFNEIDPGKPTDHFYDEVGKYLEQIDIYRHLRTTSTWHPSAKDCRHSRLDIGQVHHYMRPVAKENYKNEVEVVLDRVRFLRENAPNKPVLIGEFGLATEKWGLSEQMKDDKEGVHFHNSLWASAFAGASGTALFWWWDQLDRQDAYRHYQPLAAFLADVSFEGLGQLKGTTSNQQIRLLGYQGEDCAYFWLFNQQATWWNLVVEKQQPSEIKDANIEIDALKPGSYHIEWWSTLGGSEIKVVEESELSLAGGPLRIDVPPFSRDIACKIRPAGQRRVLSYAQVSE